ncbi:MAG: porin [Burkholderiales bacterium]
MRNVRKPTFNRRSIAASLLGVVLSAGAAPVLADTETLLDKLREKGVLSEEEYQEMRTGVRAERRAQALKSAQGAEKSEKALTSWGKVKGNGLGLESADGQNAINLTGRVHFDIRDYSHDMFDGSDDRDTASVANGFEMRRARIGFNGYVFKDLGFEVVANAVGSSANLIDTAWVNLGYVKPAQLRFGRFKQPFSLEELTSSNNIDFMERSYVNQVVPAKKLGAMVHGELTPGLTYGVSLFQEGFNQESANDGIQTAARITGNIAQFAGWNNAVLHLGIAGTKGHYQVRPAVSTQTTSGASGTTRATIIGFRSENRGLNNVYRAQINGTTLATAGQFAGALDEIGADVDKNLSGLEIAAAYGPFKLQMEYVNAGFDATHPAAAANTVAGDVKTQYMEAIWNITGEKWADAYRTGVFSGVRPLNNFNAGAGAWQLALRLSEYDASDVTVGNTTARQQNNNKAETLTLGVNWLLNPNARIMLNYAKTDFKGTCFSGSGNTTSTTACIKALDVTSPATQTAIDSETVVSLRAQVNF